MSQTASPFWFWIVALAVIGAIEMNALTAAEGGPKRILGSLSGTFAAGFVLLALFYVLINLLR